MSAQYMISCFAINNLLLLLKLLKVAWTDGGTVLTFPWHGKDYLHRVQLVK